MKLSESGMVQFVTADFEIPLFAVEGVRGVVVKTAYRFNSHIGTIHGGEEANRLPTDSLGPPLVQRAFVEKYNVQLINVVLFNVAPTGRCTATNVRNRCNRDEYGWEFMP